MKLKFIVSSLCFAAFCFMNGVVYSEEPGQADPPWHTDILSQNTKSTNNHQPPNESDLKLPDLEKQLADEMSEDKTDQTPLNQFLGRFEVGVVIEFEAIKETSRPVDEKKETHDDVSLSTIELEIVAQLSSQFKTEVLFEYEDGKDDIDISEAILHFQANGVCEPNPDSSSTFYASIGKMDLPFGNYENRLISSPLTEDLGSVQTKTIMAGLHNSVLNIAVGLFNADMDEEGSSAFINGFWGTGFIYFPQTAESEFEATIGASFISNIADSDELSSYIKEEFEIDSIQKDVPGFSTFLSLSWEDSIFLDIEFVTALKRFKEDDEFKPEAWNVELAFKPVDIVQLAARIGKSNDALDFLPETVWAAGVIVECIEGVFLAGEYLEEKFENKDETTVLTAQLVIEF